MDNLNMNRLKKLREKAGLTQEEVGKLLDQSGEAVSRHETGARGLTKDMITKYSKVYKVESYELFLEPAHEDEG